MKYIALGSVVGVLVGRYFGKLDRFDVELIVGIFLAYAKEKKFL